MLNLETGMHYSEILAVIRAKRDAIRTDLEELRGEGAAIIAISADDLIQLELAGYIISLESGRVLAGPARLIL